MSECASISSIEGAGDAISEIAQQHIDRTFRRLRSPRAEVNSRFVRVITGAAHPFGNFVLCRDPADADSVLEAAEPLRVLDAPSVVLLVGRASVAVDRSLHEAGFANAGVMPGMAVDIDALPSLALPDRCIWESCPAGRCDEEWIDAFAAGYEIPRSAAAVYRRLGFREAGAVSLYVRGSAPPAE